MQERLAQENERIIKQLDDKDKRIGELMEERQERAKRHLQEIENLKLSHQ